MAILDTGFFSSLYKINRLDLLFKSESSKDIVIAEAVYDEIKNSPFYNNALHIFTYNKDDLKKGKFIFVKKVDILDVSNYFNKEEINVFGKGEIGCFLLAKETNDVVFIDDKKARTFAMNNNLRVASLSTFLLNCRNKKILAIQEIKDIISDLKEKDLYEFSNESKEELLK